MYIHVMEHIRKKRTYIFIFKTFTNIIWIAYFCLGAWLGQKAFMPDSEDKKQDLWGAKRPL